MQLGNIKYTPVGYELGYCIGEDITTKERNVYYFKGYPKLDYPDCEIIRLDNADVDTFSSNTIMGEGKDKNNKFFKGKVVKKGTGKILSQDWIFIPNNGVICEDISISFGMERINIRNLLNNEQQYNFSRSDSEDSYEEFQNTNTWFRLGYDDNDLLQEIEFLNGNLRYDKIIILGDVNIKDLVNGFLSLGFKFHLQEFGDGLICEELKAVIASGEDLGGDGQECQYFYTSSDISHLLEE